MYLQYSIAFENKQVKFYTITKPVAKSFVQMIMRKGFPLRDKINFKIRFVPYNFTNDIYLSIKHVVIVDGGCQSVSAVHARRFTMFVLDAQRHIVRLGHSTFFRFEKTWSDGKGEIQPDAQTHLLTSNASKLV